MEKTWGPLSLSLLSTLSPPLPSFLRQICLSYPAGVGGTKAVVPFFASLSLSLSLSLSTLLLSYDEREIYWSAAAEEEAPV